MSGRRARKIRKENLANGGDKASYRRAKKAYKRRAKG